MRRLSITLISLLALCGASHATMAADNAKKTKQKDAFQQLDDQTQELKLRIIDLNRAINHYAAKSNTDIARQYKGKNRVGLSMDFVYRDQRNGDYLSAINRYHAGRDFGMILSKYETALKVADIYLDYGLYHYSKKIFTKLLGDEDSAVASMARYYLAKHDYQKHYWDAALKGFESVTDGIPLDMLDNKRIMQGIILQDRKRHDDAIKLLSQVQPTSKYFIYAQFNIAMSYLRKGWWSDAEGIIYKMLKNNELKDNAKKESSRKTLPPYMRDRFYIALGYSQLQREYYREAYGSLKNVSKSGPYSYKAQLGLAIVAAEQENYKESLKRLEDLKQSYSKQLVAEEAHIVTPFILESIGSLDTTTNYYAKAINYYQQTIQEIDDIQSRLTKGQYDTLVGDFSNVGSSGRETTPPGDVFVDKPISRYVYELVETNRWLEASRNYRDISELSQFLDKLQTRLQASGKYQVKTYKKLRRKIHKDKSWIVTLSDRYRQYLRSMIDDHMAVRKKYFLSYMNQSRFALARIYDNTLGTKQETRIAGNTVTEKKVRSLYRQYLATAIPASHNRRMALLRLAELELDKYDQLMAQQSDGKGGADDAKQRLTASIDLLNTALKDYPDKKDNDKVLYQLVTAYDKQGQPEKAQVAMRQLVDNYPQSQFYTETQFKLGEKYLTTNDSIDAELAYTAAIQRENVNSSFYWRSLYKRGWSRLRQSVYKDALDDFFEVLTLSHLAEKSSLDVADEELYSDILRGISLCFSNMGGLDRLNQYYKSHSDSPYAYLAYQELGKMYESQQRVYDAVEVYEAYIKHNAMSSHAPEFLIKTIKAWEKARQPKKALQARRALEQKYSINSAFWKTNDITKYNNIREALEANATYMASHYHGLYQQSHNPQYLQSAKYWYERFARYDSKTSKAAKTYFMYADLLTEAGEPDKALAYYEKADKGNTDTHAKKEAAYAAVVTANNIYKKHQGTPQQDQWLLKEVRYTIDFINKYPADQRSLDAALHIVESLYSRKLYQKAIDTIEQIPQATKRRIVVKLRTYKAHCLFALNEFKTAEQIYSELYTNAPPDKLDKQLIADRLASSIYKQGELAEKAGNESEAVEQYLRVFKTVPDSSVVAVAEFDAANALIKEQQYEKATAILERFLTNFKGHRLTAKVNNKLALIYLKDSNKPKSALAFERASKDSNNDIKVRRDALWQAAQINDELNNVDKAISLYERYTNEFSGDHEPVMEAKWRLAALYQKVNNDTKRNAVLQSMVESEGKIRLNMSTERTKYLAANAALDLIDQEIQTYKSLKIRQPLKVTLKKKKLALQNLVKELTKVTDYAIEETTTEAIYQIAEAYNDFSKALINSPRPSNLKDLELQQYELLLEEQAYPFEEKALSFYKENLKIIKEGIYNKWVKNSFDRLTKLVPARYNKKEKLEPFIDIPLEPAVATN